VEGVREGGRKGGDVLVFTRHKVRDRSRKGDPGVGDLRAADLGALHAHQRQDAAEEARADGAHGHRSDGVEERWEGGGAEGGC